MTKRTTKADLLLHPQRLRIVQTFLGRTELTVQQIAERLTDIPQATLYRHLNELVKGGVLLVVRRNQVRGAVEKVYALSANGANVTPDDLDYDAREELMRQFMLFVSMLLGDFEAYLKRDEIDLLRDGVGFRQAAFYLTNEEFTQLAQKVGALFREAMSNEPAPGRTRRTISTIMMPGAETNPTSNGET